MAQFTVYSVGCQTCTHAVANLKTAIAKRGCGCSVEESSCDGHCDAAKRLNFEGKKRPVVVRDNKVIHSGALSEEHAATLLPTT
jgi:hypothetical protein